MTAPSRDTAGGAALPRVSQREGRCLAALAEALAYPEQCVLSYGHITSETKMELHQARRAVRALKRKGLAELSPCFDDDGFIRGSGYVCTDLGMQVHTALASTPTGAA